MTVPLRLDATGATLRFVLREGDGGATAERSRAATVDIGREGRLVGVEVDLGTEEPLYLEVEPDASAYARSVPTSATVTVLPGGEVVMVEVSRRGAGYEVTYPVGNR
ncbi:MAG: hypothetical protein AVDCRST_MAG49-623 [uncultured Thermomicrobiales bacterium]|uniref:Uncharacterized protein n=1 Tax=uncultured Thermomicrobiales bacterium TaxID=1645740 RepID=A0A6J4U294_9BACT|nr:MAG: hypothetical protein AVDCRST_MAG49-623 [uncultured Thermomicrobiales bacterium]